MKGMSTALRAHYASGSTTLATCWRATLTNGTVVAGTTLDTDIVFEGVTYLATTGGKATDVESSSELNPDNLEIEGFLQSPAITEADLHSGAWDYASVEIFEVNYNDLTMGRNVLRFGTLGEVKAGRAQFSAELRGLMQAYSRRIVMLTVKDCPHDLGDAKCKVDLAAITVSGVVGSAVENRVINDASRTEAADWFTAAKLTFTTGANAGLGMEIKRSTPGQIELHEKMPFAVAAGDQYTTYKGCTKRFEEDCVARHGNGINFGGFPHLPGHSIYKVGGNK